MAFKLKIKIPLLFLSLVLISSVSSLFIAGYTVKNNLTNDLINRIINNSQAEISDLTNFVLTDNKESIINLIFNQKAAHTDVAYMLVIDENNRLLASTLVVGDEATVQSYNTLPQGENKRIVLIKQEDGREVYDTALRLDYNKGIFRVGYFKNQIDQSITNVLRSLAIGSSLSIVIALFFAWLFSRGILNPLNKLHEHVNKIKEGKLGVKIYMPSNDEVGDVAAAFNEMTAKLAETYQHLDEKIKEKTADLSLKVIEVEKSKSAILNLLEDLDVEKKKVDQIVVERTSELQAEKARLLASINSLSFGFVIADTNHMILVKNKAMGELLGEKSVKASSVADIAKILGESFDVQSQIEKCLKGKVICEIKNIIFGRKSLRGIVAPIIIAEDDKKMIGYVLLFEDITEAKVLERSREEFFALASHELRTPLTAIRGNMEMFRDFTNKLKVKDKAEIIQDTYDASTRLIAIVNDFLDVSRLEQGKITFKKEPFDLVVALKGVTSKIEPLATAKHLTFTVKQPPKGLPMVYGDVDRTTQVLFNLLGNAINYTEQGGITVMIEKASPLLRVVVTDTGKGISPGNQALLFRKFQQAGEKILTRDVTKGTGLGLYISKLMVEAMGGSIELVESVSGKGSTFAFSLPIDHK